MAKKKRNWSSEETLMAFTLYRALPPREYDDTGRDVQALAKAIGRSSNAVALKIANIAAHDPERIKAGRKGLAHGSRLDSAIWVDYAGEGDALVSRGLELLDQVVYSNPENLVGDSGIGGLVTGGGATPLRPDATFVQRMQEDIPEGYDRLVATTVRVNQNYFRNSLLANYHHRCCVTGLEGDSLLVASHIKPWAKSDPRTERTASSNGILLNALHDRAFDQGLITLDSRYRVRVSRRVKHDSATDAMIWAYDGRRIELPEQESLRPRADFIEYHNDEIFQG